jgi:hypothetical protein
MLPQSTITLINGQIETELKHLNSIFCDTQEDKMNTLERINKLRSMLVTESSVQPLELGDKETEIDLGAAVKDIANLFKRRTK